MGELNSFAATICIPELRVLRANNIGFFCGTSTMVLDEGKIRERMQELNERIGSPVENPMLLAPAMDATREDDQFKGKNHDNHRNEALATLGDAVLRLVLAEMLFSEGSKGRITEEKQALENNGALYQVFVEQGLYKFAFTDNGFSDEVGDHQRVSNHGDHSPYIEAIIGVIYREYGLEAVRKWILEWYVPKVLDLKSSRHADDC